MEADADFYLTLGVKPDADSAAIRAAYRNLMRRYHPDVNASEDAAAKATSINEAYACLSDEDRRAAYDHARKPKPASRPFAAAARAARPMRAQHAHFYQQRTFAAELEPDPPPTKWKIASLTLALLVTLVTFTLTSATPPAPPPPPPATISVALEAPPPAARSLNVPAGSAD